VAEHECSKIDCALLPRAIRAGPHPGCKKFGLSIPGVYLIFFGFGGLSRHGGTLGLTECFYDAGGYLIFFE